MIKKIFVFVVLTLTLFSVFAEGTPEQQRLLFQQLPGIIQELKAETGDVTTTYETGSVNSAALGSAIIERDMASLTRLYKYLDQNFLWDIDYDAVYDAMANAMFEALDDKYTYYVKASEVEEYEEDTTGQYGGLGFYHTKYYVEYQDENDISTLYSTITQVFPNTPAAAGGLKAGDMITHIDGESVIEMEATECSSKIKGAIGSEVTLTILRQGASFDLTFKRAKIDVPTIVYDMIDDEIGYIQILEFYNKTSTDFRNAYDQLRDRGMKHLVLDLRNCPGGDVDATLKIANMFIADAKLLTVGYKSNRGSEVKWASPDVYIDPDVKVAILINGNSASASEILASTMRDNGRAVLIGEKSYGKGIIQAISSFGDGDASITVAEYLPPAGEKIHKVGIEPDIEVKTEVIQEDETEAYQTLISSTLITDFISEHPEYSVENVDLFVTLHPDTGLRPEIVRIMVANEYVSAMNYDEQPKFDLWFDKQLIEAVNYLK